MRELYPEIEPLETGMLDVGDGQHIYWEVSGNREGKPAVFLHGGPGGPTPPAARPPLGPGQLRVVVVGQRRCRFFNPQASEPEARPPAKHNVHPRARPWRLGQHLSIDRWLVFGGSWGSALGL